MVADLASQGGGSQRGPGGPRARRRGGRRLHSALDLQTGGPTPFRVAFLSGSTPPASLPLVYEARRWRFRHLMEFPVARIEDYARARERLEKESNPFAMVVLAQLEANEARGDGARLAAKLRLVRLMYERGHTRKDIINLFRFIDWLLSLPRELELAVERQVEALEKEKVRGGEHGPCLSNLPELLRAT